MTKLRDEMKKAGADVDAARLYTLATGFLQKNQMLNRRAAEALTDEVRKDGGVLVALVPKEVIFQHALLFVERVARDMKSPKGPGAVQPIYERQSVNGRPQHSPQGGAGVLKPVGIHDATGPGDNSARADGEVLNQRAIQAKAGLSDSSPKGAGDAGSCLGVRRQINYGLASPNKPKIGPAEMKKLREVAPPSVFDTYRLRDGVSIGDLRYSQLDRYIGANKREAALLEMVRKHGKPADPNTKLRDMLSMATLQKFIQKAAEVSDD